MKQFSRVDRISEEMRKIISGIIDGDYQGKFPGMVTLTFIKVTKDLRYAAVNYSFLGTEEQREWIAGFFERERKQIRYLLGNRMSLRHVPELTFKFDPSIEEGLHIEKLLNQIKNDEKKMKDQ